MSTKTLRFLTWLDVQRFFRKKTIYGSHFPEGVIDINCFSDALEVSLSSDLDIPKMERILKEWLGEWYQTETKSIQIDLGNMALPVEFIKEESKTKSSAKFKPFWQEVAYQDNSLNESERLSLPTSYDKPPSLIAFYSFKGGVGRTLHLASYLFALLKKANESHKEIKILVIDADLEAPGLTYWGKKEKQQPSVSFIDFLEAYHCSKLSKEEILEFFSKEISKSAKQEGNSSYTFLPACLSDEQLLDTTILPEHLARRPGDGWAFTDAIHELGRFLGVDYILVDLRAGLSEISSPLIFDSRVQRFLVTTATEQSVAGLNLVLEQISRVAPSGLNIQEGQYFDPSIIVSFLTPELQVLPAFEDVLEGFRTSYVTAAPSDGSNSDLIRLEILETEFSQELLYVNSWDEARKRLTSTSVARVADEWATFQIKNHSIVPNNDLAPIDEQTYFEKVRRFKEKCKEYEFAESGTGNQLLVTDTLKNLAKNFQSILPRVVSLGAKGSGKTFIYIQLSRLKYWEKFIELALKEKPDFKAHIFPFLQSKNLQDTAKEIIDSARDEVRRNLGADISKFEHSSYEDSILRFLKEDNITELEWTSFWIKEIARSLGMTPEDNISLKIINNYLIEKKIRIILLFDGLEDIFTNAASDERQKIALSALINLPNRLSELRQANLGLLILLRRDFLRYAVTQNVAQFESLYSPYDLSWNVDSFLKLVYWVCSQASVIEADEKKIDLLGKEELVSELQKLWGEKLGGIKEARTASWVYAALTDFKGKLQARDIVRLLFNAAEITINRSREVQASKWSSDRLLPPQAIRRALEPCSEQKVVEAKEEYPEFKKWVEKVESDYKDGQKRIPFTPDDLRLDHVNIKMLEDMGVIYEDRAKDDIVRYYMPEIFRAGLKFTLESGKRPRVLVLKRKALGVETL